MMCEAVGPRGRLVASAAMSEAAFPLMSRSVVVFCAYSLKKSDGLWIEVPPLC